MRSGMMCKLTGQRRGLTTLAVIAVLSLLFIIGTSLLLTLRFEKKAADQHVINRDMQAVTDAVQDMIMRQLREDIVGKDGLPYNHGWSTDTSAAEDYADFAGRAGPG